MTVHRQLDPSEITVIGHALHTVAVEMGVALRRTAFSPNIKERRDYSSAVFSAEGDLIAMGDSKYRHMRSRDAGIARGEACDAGVARHPARDVGRADLHLEGRQRRLRDRHARFRPACGRRGGG